MKKKETPNGVSSTMMELMGSVKTGVDKAKAKAEERKAEIEEVTKMEDTLREADRIKEAQKQAERDRLAEKKATRNQQRSIKFDDVTIERLKLVKSIWQKGGVVRPAVDDIIYTAVVEYLDKHYPDTKELAERLVEIRS